MNTGLEAVQARLAAAVSRVSRVRDLYLTEGTTASEVVEAERLGNRAAGMAYALTIVEDVLEEQRA